MPVSVNASDVRSKLESVLFAAGKPLSLKKLAEMLAITMAEVEAAVKELAQIYHTGNHGLEVILHQGEAVMATLPKHSDLVRDFIKAEELGDLTRPQLEALSVLAYRGPLTKAELEQVRGVNCSLILRNLQMRGLIARQENKNGLIFYEVTPEFVKYLGVSSVQDLPDYDKLHQHATLNEVLQSVNAGDI